LAPSLYRLPDNRPSIAVLPFRKLRPRPEDAYFADGVVEEIIHLLSGLKELFVISRTSTLKFADSEFDARSIGRELGVRYILYGSIRRAGDRLRIGTELTDTDTGRIIRSDFHEGEITDIFKLQEKIATQVAKAIAPHVREMELQRTRRKHPSNFTAYDLVLQALDLLYRVDRESVARARGLLQQAISLDPSFAQSYSYMAYLLVFRVGESWSPNPREDAREAARVASKAIEIEPNDAQAWAIYGHVQSFLLKDFKTAMTYLDRALEVGPNNAMAWTMSSATCGYVGNGQAAVERAEHGLRLSPLDAHVFWHEAILAQAHYINGDFQQAIAWAERAAEHKATAIFNLRTLTASLIALGRIQEAAETWGHLLSIQPDFDLAAYEEGCPFQQPLLGVWMQRLRIAAKAHEGHRQRSHPWSEQSSRRKEQYHDG